MDEKDEFYYDNKIKQLLIVVNDIFKQCGLLYEIYEDELIPMCNSVINGTAKWFNRDEGSLNSFAQNSIDSYKSFVSKRALLSEKIKDNKIIEYGEDATETKEYDKQPINNIVDNVEKSDIKNENNINIVNNNVIKNNTSENNNSENNKNKLIEPNVKIDKIEIDVGKDKFEEAEQVIKNYGKFVPLLKIKDILINTGDILYYSYSVRFNGIPTFIITIDDSFNRFKSLFQDDELITAIAFIGNKNWYHKVNILINDTLSSNNGTLTLYGILHNPKIYETVQNSFSKQNLVDVFKDICTNTDLGLFLNENDKLTQQLPLILNTNNRYIDLVYDLVSKYSHNNFWCLDNYYMLHLQNYDTLINKETDKYKLKDGKDNTDELPVIITNYPNPSNDIEEDLKKFVAYDYVVNNNNGLNSINTSKSYTLNNESITSHEKIGLGTTSGNTFSKFKENTFPFYNEIFLKDITGNMFELKMQTPLYEIFPFMVVETEIYNLSEDKETREYIKNEKHSGKHIIMEYEFEYVKPNKMYGNLIQKPNIIQTIKLI